MNTVGLKHLAAAYGPPLLLGLCIASTLATIWFGLNTIVDLLFWMNGAELPRALPVVEASGAGVMCLASAWGLNKVI